MDNLKTHLNSILEMLNTWTPKILLALMTLIIGWVAINVFAKWFRKLLNFKHVDETLAPFLVSFTKTLLKLLLIITVAGMLGLVTTSFVALLGAAGLAVGLALQGSLSNLAGGVLLLIFRPFKVGDVIEAQGFNATVKEIRIFQTHLVTFDNREVILPNGPLANGSIVNFSVFDTRRIDLVFGISYSDDLKKAKSLIESVISDDERILEKPEPTVELFELADSSVNLSVKVWVNRADFGAVKFSFMEKVKIIFDENSITIPYPQRELHIVGNNGIQSGEMQ